VWGSKPERVRDVKKTVRWTVFSLEVCRGYASRTGNAKQCRPAFPAKNKGAPFGAPLFFIFGVWDHKPERVRDAKTVDLHIYRNMLS